jgi:SPP1 gp7 family putative phage head morphogenesis protein
MPPPTKPELTEADLKAVFDMPPADAIAYFERKGFKISWDWQEVWRHANVQAFTVAKATRLDVLSDIYNALSEDLKNGGTFSAFLTTLQPLLEAKGWWGKVDQTNRYTGEIRTVTYGTPWRLETIYETNLQVAYMAGRYQAMKEGAQYTPWWEYSAVMDNRTRPQHAALNGLVFRYDDPFWLTWYPPNGFRCRCRVIPRTDMAKERGDFAPSSGEGRMEQVTREIKKRDGKTAKVQMTGYKDPITGKVLTPDLGWDYNPAAESDRMQKLFRQKQDEAPGPIRDVSKKND